MKKYISITKIIKNNCLFFFLAIILLSCSKDNFNDLVESEIEKKEILLQKKIVISEMSNASIILHKVSWPILLHNTHICKKSKIFSYGFIIAMKNDLPKSSRDAYVAIYDNWEKIDLNKTNLLPKVISVAKDSPAYKAGLLSGDEIISINNNTKLREEIYLSSSERKKLSIKIKRNQIIFNVIIDGIDICGFNVQPLASGSPNAFSDGQKIFVTIAALKLAKSNDEIAFLVGHELAHNIFHFKGKGTPESETLPISFQDKPKYRRAYDIFMWPSLDKEVEADIEGIRLAYNAGYDLKNAANYWRRLSIFNPNLISDTPSMIYKGNAFRASTIESIIKKLK